MHITIFKINTLFGIKKDNSKLKIKINKPIKCFHIIIYSVIGIKRLQLQSEYQTLTWHLRTGRLKKLSRAAHDSYSSWKLIEH